MALVWQLMRAYTLSILSQLTSDDKHTVVESEIVDWVNRKVSYFHGCCAIHLHWRFLAERGRKNFKYS